MGLEDERGGREELLEPGGAKTRDAFCRRYKGGRGAVRSGAGHGMACDGGGGFGAASRHGHRHTARRAPLFFSCALLLRGRGRARARASPMSAQRGTAQPASQRRLSGQGPAALDAGALRWAPAAGAAAGLGRPTPTLTLSRAPHTAGSGSSSSSGPAASEQARGAPSTQRQSGRPSCRVAAAGPPIGPPRDADGRHLSVTGPQVAWPLCLTIPTIRSVSHGIGPASQRLAPVVSPRPACLMPAVGPPATPRQPRNALPAQTRHPAPRWPRPAKPRFFVRPSSACCWPCPVPVAASSQPYGRRTLDPRPLRRPPGQQRSAAQRSAAHRSQLCCRRCLVPSAAVAVWSPSPPSHGRPPLPWRASSHMPHLRD